MQLTIGKTYQVNKYVSFEVIEKGTGEPLVYLHGLNGLKWDSFLDELSSQYRVIAPHIPGTGTSEGLENIRDIWDLVLAYNDLFDVLGLERVNIIGHSVGAMIAAGAANNPERVKNLVLMSPLGFFREDYPYDVFGMTPSEFSRGAVIDQDSTIAQSLKRPTDPEERMDWTVERTMNMNAAAKFLWPIPDKRLKYRIHRIKAPTLLLWGKEDGIVPSIYAEEFEKRITNCKLHIFDNSAHMLQVEKKDEVLNLAKDFIKKD